jgi:hypothetical protein
MRLLPRRRWLRRLLLWGTAACVTVVGAIVAVGRVFGNERTSHAWRLDAQPCDVLIQPDSDAAELGGAQVADSLRHAPPRRSG